MQCQYCTSSTSPTHILYCTTPSPYSQAWFRPPLWPLQLQASPNDTASHPPALQTHRLSDTCCSLHLPYQGRLTQRWNHVLWSSPSSSRAHPAHAPSLHRDSCAYPLFLVMFFRPSACLQITSSSSFYPFPPHVFTLLPEKMTFISFSFCFFCSFKISLHTPLWPISSLLMFFHVAVPSLWESSPTGAHYRRAWSWLPGSRLICHIPVPSRCRAQQIGGVVEWCVQCGGSWCWGWWGLSRTARSGEHRKAFFYGPCLLLSCFLTVSLVSSEGRQRVTCWECFHVAFVMSPVLFTLIRAVLFMPFVLHCEMEMALIHLLGAWDGLKAGNLQWRQRFMSQTDIFQHVGFVAV